MLYIPVTVVFLQYLPSYSVSISFSEMDVSSSSAQDTAGLSKQLMGKQNENKQETKAERKPRFRHLTDEMLEKYRRVSEESDLFRKQYEEAVYKVYGTLPPRKMFFKPTKKKED